VKDEFEDLSPAPRSRWPRMILALAVGLLAVWGFYRHFQNVTGRFAAEEEIYDQTKRLSPDELDRLHQAAQAFRRDYGLNLRVAVLSGPVTPPVVDAGTIYIGLDVPQSRAVVIVPPLLAKSLPPDMAARLAGDFFAPYFAAQAWPEGLLAWTSLALEALGEQK